MFIQKYFRNFFSFSIHSIEVGTQPLKTTQSILTSLCICPSDEFPTPSKKRVFASIVAATQICSFATSLTYLIKFITIDFEGSLFAFLAFIGHTTLIYSFLIALSLRHKIRAIFEQLASIYNNSKHAILNFHRSFLFYFFYDDKK